MGRSKSRSRIYEAVTQEIIKRIELGTKPWAPRWVGADDHPRNALTRQPYLGLNALILFSTSYNLGFRQSLWMTERQARLMGGEVKAGERATTIFFGKRAFTRTQDRIFMRRNEGNPGYAFQRMYLLFNVAQVHGLPPEPVPPPASRKHIYPRLRKLLGATKADIRVGGKRAYFDGAADYIQLPPRGLFFDPRDRGDYGRTTLHELAHWAVDPRRLHIRLVGDSNYHRYAWGELIAELSAAYACAVLGIAPTAEPADYLAEYLRILKSEADLLLQVAPDAACVSEHILSFDPGQ